MTEPTPAPGIQIKTPGQPLNFGNPSLGNPASLKVCGIDLSKEGGAFLKQLLRSSGAVLGHPLFKNLNHVSAADEAKAKKFLKSGDDFMQKKNYVKAAEHYLESVKSDPRQDQVLLKLGLAALAGKDPVTAHDALSLYLAKQPCDHQARALRQQAAQ